MKISGYGSGKNSRQSTGDRTTGFRRNHQVGDTVSGKLVRWERPGLAWINFEGHLLTARISSSPPLGESLLFLIKSLSPEILLQELHPAGAEALAGDAGRTFAHRRTKFDSGPHTRAAARILAPLSSWKDRRAAFFAVLEEDDQFAAVWLETHSSMCRLSRALEAAGHGRAAWLPWLIPGANRMELLFKPRREAGGYDILMGFRLPKLGACRAMIVEKNQEQQLHLALPCGMPASEVQRIKRVLAEATGPGICFGGVSELNPSASTGPLAELLAGLHRSKGYGTIGLNIKA